MELIDLEQVKGRVINIQHYCYQDGPGVRTTVFVKGCSLQCKWCGNPESIYPDIELAYDKKDCLGKEKCGLCLKEPFPKGLFYVDENSEDDKIKVNWENAAKWDRKEIDICPSGALFCYGNEVTAKEVIEEVDQDAIFYGKNGGGLTISGGEPLLQPEFSAALYQLAHKHGYTTAIETASNVPWEWVEQVLPHVDTVLHDIKIINPEKHKQWIGVSNERILENLKRAYETWPEKKFIARTPIIPGFNDDEESIEEILDFILPYKNVVKYELMPYHRLGTGKYVVLGRKYELEDFRAPSEEKIKLLRDKIENAFAKRNV